MKWARTEMWTRLENGARSKEGYERGGAIRAFGELKDPRALSLLQQTAQRCTAIRFERLPLFPWGNWQIPEVIPILEVALNDGIPAVRSVAAYSMGYFPPQQVQSSLTAALADQNPGVQAAADGFFAEDWCAVFRCRKDDP